MKTLKIGIASYEKMKARTMAIARGTLKRQGRRAEGMVRRNRGFSTTAAFW